MAALTTEAVPPARLSDELLVRRICDGQPELFDLLYERYFARVFRFVDRRMPTRSDTEETVQEVFLNLFSSLASFRGEAPFAAWVFGLSRRTIAGRFKRRRADWVPLPDEDNEAPLPQTGPLAQLPDPLAAYECSERLSRLSRAAREDLTEEQWRFFQLHHLENHSIQEIAASEAKSEDAVKSHLYRARRLLMAR